MEMVRQGDVLLIPVEGYTPSENAEKRVSGIVAYGDNGSTHAHTLVGGDVFAEPNAGAGSPATLFAVVAPAGGMLTHDEHDTVEVEEGTYEARRQQDQDANGQRRHVAD